MCSKEAKPYLIKKNGVPIGTLSAKKNFSSVLEFSLEDEGELFAVMAEAARLTEGDFTTVCVPPTMPKAIRALQAAAQEVSVVYPSRFNVLEFEGLTNRLLKVKETLSPLPACDLVLQIEGGERLHLHTGADGAYCKETDEAPSLTLSHADAQRLLFGIYTEDLLAALPIEKQFALKAILPLPLTWCTNDFV
jgi:hypothetical protein